MWHGSKSASPSHLAMSTFDLETYCDAWRTASNQAARALAPKVRKVVDETFPEDSPTFPSRPSTLVGTSKKYDCCSVPAPIMAPERNLELTSRGSPPLAQRTEKSSCPLRTLEECCPSDGQLKQWMKRSPVRTA
eukprot:CAMPEP_0184376488 /NCGR_PEP_ID=MMETSP0007-20130409/1493_1 /TAXON_ID=97485 /ORGANISM="Prymnesium parvum, Strain Texoma1" /LENGTH=133 /DNA_ID=CAMNT_0026720051 /DNA_START=130 /DNA_END=531 /DNA_ORIENTATION=+